MARRRSQGLPRGRGDRYFLPTTDLARVYESDVTYWGVGEQLSFVDWPLHEASASGCYCWDHMAGDWLSREAQIQQARAYSTKNPEQFVCAGESAHRLCAVPWPSSRPSVELVDMEYFFYDECEVYDAWDEHSKAWSEIRIEVEKDPGRLFDVDDAMDLALSIYSVLDYEPAVDMAEHGGRLWEGLLKRWDDPSVRAATLDIGIANAIMDQCPPWPGMLDLGKKISSGDNALVHPSFVGLLEFDAADLDGDLVDGVWEVRRTLYESLFDLTEDDRAVHPFVPGWTTYQLRLVTH